MPAAETSSSSFAITPRRASALRDFVFIMRDKRLSLRLDSIDEKLRNVLLHLHPNVCQIPLLM
jgi:hypothetical protein